MFLSLSEKFVFLGNRKAASTSMESFLRLRCEICASGGKQLSDQRSSKHMDYAEWVRAYANFLEKIRRSPENFLVFGIVREPMARFVSSYAFRTRHTERPRTPDEFVAAAANDADRGIDPDTFLQRKFFAREDGEIGANFLIRLERHEEDLQRLLDETGLDLRGAFGERRNASQSADFNVESAELRQWLDDYLAPDVELYEEHSGRLLEPVSPSNDIRLAHAMRILLRSNPTDVAATIMYNLRARQSMDMKPHVMRVLKVARNATGRKKAAKGMSDQAGVGGEGASES